jgi:hypothetical protein
MVNNTRHGLSLRRTFVTPPFLSYFFMSLPRCRPSPFPHPSGTHTARCISAPTVRAPIQQIASELEKVAAEDKQFRDENSTFPPDDPSSPLGGPVPSLPPRRSESMASAASSQASRPSLPPRRQSNMPAASPGGPPDEKTSKYYVGRRSRDEAVVSCGVIFLRSRSPVALWNALPWCLRVECSPRILSSAIADPP